MIDGLFLVQGVVVAVCAVAYMVILRPHAGTAAAAFFGVASVMGFLSGQHIALPLLLLLVALEVRRRAKKGLHVRRPGWTEGALQVGVIASGYMAYTTARVIAEGGYREARGNSLAIIDFEKTMGFFVEPHIQDFVMQSMTATELLMTVYSYLFFTVVVAVAFWMFLVDEKHYAIFRNTLGISAAIGVVLFSTFPVAPPRLVPSAEIIDVAAYLGRTQTFANEYAAVPSLHVGWLMLVGFVVSRVYTAPWLRVLAFVPGFFMAFVVVATGNHYITDFIIGSAICIGPAAIMAYGPGWLEERRVGARRRATG